MQISRASKVAPKTNNSQSKQSIISRHLRNSSKQTSAEMRAKAKLFNADTQQIAAQINCALLTASRQQTLLASTQQTSAQPTLI